MEFNEKAKAREGDYLKIDGQIWVQAWSRRVRCLRYHTDSSLQIQKLYGNTLRAGKMAMPPLVCTFSFEVGKNIQLRLPFF